MSERKLVLLDFTEHDTIEAANLIRLMAEQGQVVGMIFALQLAHSQPRRIMLGATGRPANDMTVATGLSALLHCNIARAAMEEANAA